MNEPLVNILAIFTGRQESPHSLNLDDLRVGSFFVFKISYMKYLLLATMLLISLNSFSQSCDELMEYVKSKSYGTTYHSYTSTAISKVTFYDLTIDYNRYYFAVVCFKGNGYSCSEYIYQVSSSTKLYYSMNYLESAGKAFWEYIQPYNETLNCAPNFN